MSDFEAIVLNEDQDISLSEEVRTKVSDSHKFLVKYSADKIIYGVNTGFGPMAQHIIPQDQQKQLQYNLIRSHSTGSGNELPTLYIRAILLARLKSLCCGYSGITLQTVELLSSFINNKIYPCIYEHGGVGASGDLVQLSHLALSSIGEGKVNFEGHKMATKDAMEKAGVNPLEISLREGLALINGTSGMTGIGLLNVHFAHKLLNTSILAGAMLNEIIESFDDHFSDGLQAVKKHDGQKIVAKKIQDILEDSQLIKKRYDLKEMHQNGSLQLAKKMQEYYSMRCLPQILGPIHDTLQNVEKVLINELNSANDNPIIDAEREEIYHGGNFHGDYISLEMDKLKIVLTKLSMLAERQLNFLLNDKLNNKLPPFVNLGKLGLNFGMQGAQFTATSTTAENQTHAFPMYVHSIPNNNDNQDIVSMGTNAANITRKVIENCFEVLSIELISLAQAIDYLKIEDKLASKTKDIYTKIRALVPVIIEDRPLYEDIAKVKDYLTKSEEI